MEDEPFVPRQYLGVMVSSTFRDLEQHRAALMKAIEGQGLHAVAMEQDSALPDGTVVDSSLRKVRDAAAYIGVISSRYGNVPDSADSNPEHLSLTELEFREARRLGRPMLVFIMGADHEVKVADVERDPEKLRKLEAFREDAKRATAQSSVHRVYKEFNNLNEFAVAATQSVAELRRFLDERYGTVPADRSLAGAEPDSDTSGGIPQPPALYAQPRYIASHMFVGRTAELETLSDWAGPAEPHPVLLFEAIGGTGKSMLTWEWTVSHASDARPDWAGRFWYSFYEKGAVMADFCRHALAYLTGQPVRAFHKTRPSELRRQLLLQLEARPSLLVLDGLERVLVAYHRYDAAQVADEEAGRTDEIARRDPCDAIRPEDDELLRGLAGAAPSKILITSRLVPRSLLNQAGQPIPGVLYERLPGLRPADAEALLRTCGVRGDSQSIRTYLQQHCDCHPLVTGIVAGLVNEYLPNRGDFDAWAADPGYGGRLNLADLDLVQKRNHILKSAMDALPDKNRQLLATLALLSEAADYETLTMLNPHRPPRLEPPPPKPVPGHVLESPEYQAATRELARTVRDLERRGLLQYDRRTDRYDLHPVVRGFASGSLGSEDRDRFGRRVVDYFSQRPQDPYEQAETLDDVKNGLQLVRALLQMGLLRDAADVYADGLADALLYNLEANAEVLSLLLPFFARDFTAPSAGIADYYFPNLASNAVIAFRRLGQEERALALLETILGLALAGRNPRHLVATIYHIGENLANLNRLAQHDKCTVLALDAAELADSDAHVFRARLNRFVKLASMGRWADAEAMWQALDPMGRDWPRYLYRPGIAEHAYAEFQFWRGGLTEELLARAERLAKQGRNRTSMRQLQGLRGQWLLERGEWALAADCLYDGIRMTRETGPDDSHLEILLALARFRLGQLPDARAEALRLSAVRDGAQLPLAELWHAIGDPGRATEHALVAYQWAWADGEPYVHRHELNRATSLLRLLGAEIPALPGYDPARDQPLPFENEIRAFIGELRAERGRTGSDGEESRPD